MIYKPHEYQKYAIDFINTHPISAVMLDMGLGKTSITLTAVNELLFDSFEISKVLIIAPLRVARTTWKDEIKKWNHLSNIQYSIVAGTAEERIAALKKKADIYIINRENVSWLVEDSGQPFDFDMIVIDELSSFKNHQAKRFRSLSKVRPKVKRIVGLTGTPAPNGLMDLWAEYKLLDMGKRLGRFIGEYRRQYFKPDKTNGVIVYSYKPLPFAEEVIYNQISDITISMKATDHLEMPELININHMVELSEKERKIYDKLKKELTVDLDKGDITVANAATLVGKLSQLANGCVYNDDGQAVELHERKLDALEDIIEAANGKPLIVAYWYKHDLQRIEQRLKKIGACYDKLNTDTGIKKWNEGKLPVALIHPASAGHGLNLQEGGCTMVWFGLTWSLELYQQTVARLWRQGQTSKTVVMIHIIAKDTIDEKTVKSIGCKKVTQDSLIDAVKAEL